MTHGRAGLPQQPRDLGLPLRTADISALRRLVCQVPAAVIATHSDQHGVEGGILDAWGITRASSRLCVIAVTLPPLNSEATQQKTASRER